MGKYLFSKEVIDKEVYSSWNESILYTELKSVLLPAHVWKLSDKLSSKVQRTLQLISMSYELLQNSLMPSLATTVV